MEVAKTQYLTRVLDRSGSRHSREYDYDWSDLNPTIDGKRVWISMTLSLDRVENHQNNVYLFGHQKRSAIELL